MTNIIKLTVAALTFLASASAMADNIHVLLHNGSTLYAQELKSNIEAIAKEQGHTLVIQDAQGDSNTQLTQFKQACEGEDTIMVSLQDTSKAREYLDLALINGNRVVFFNRKPQDIEILQEYDQSWYVGSDNMQGGNLQAAVIHDYLQTHPEMDRNNDGFFNLVLLQGPDLNEEAKFRTINVQLTLNLKGKHTKLLRKDFCDWDKDKAQKTMEEYIKKYGLENIELCIANNDAMALGAVEALHKYNYNKGEENLIPVFGIDGTKDAMMAIARNEMQGTIMQNAALIAKAAMLMATLAAPDDQQLTKALGMRVIENNGVIELPFRLASWR